jgi:hypothetical protein
MYLCFACLSCFCCPEILLRSQVKPLLASCCNAAALLEYQLLQENCVGSQLLPSAAKLFDYYSSNSQKKKRLFLLHSRFENIRLFFKEDWESVECFLGWRFLIKLSLLMNQDESLFQEGHFLIKICYLLDPPVIQRYLAVQVHNMGDSRVSLTCIFMNLDNLI